MKINASSINFVYHWYLFFSGAGRVGDARGFSLFSFGIKKGYCDRDQTKNLKMHQIFYLYHNVPLSLSSYSVIILKSDLGLPSLDIYINHLLPSFFFFFF